MSGRELNSMLHAAEDIEDCAAQVRARCFLGIG